MPRKTIKELEIEKEAMQRRLDVVESRDYNLRLEVSKILKNRSDDRTVAIMDWDQIKIEIAKKVVVLENIAFDDDRVIDNLKREIARLWYIVRMAVKDDTLLQEGQYDNPKGKFDGPDFTELPMKTGF